LFREEEYLKGDEPFANIEVHRNGCSWAGYLCERKRGGFDLFYDHQNSDFKPLEIPKVTMLRHMIERGEDFVAHLEPQRNETKLLEDARVRLLDWIVAKVEH
jgi:hypothetical protein